MGVRVFSLLAAYGPLCAWRRKKTFLDILRLCQGALGAVWGFRGCSSVSAMRQALTAAFGDVNGAITILVERGMGN